MKNFSSTTSRWISLVALAALIGLAGCGKREAVLNPSGTLEATEIDVASLLAGRVLQVRAKLGDPVRAGDTLVVIDTELLSLQRAQTESNGRTLAAQKLVARDARSQAQHGLDLAELTYNRLRALLEQGSVTRQQVDEAETKRAVAMSQVSGAAHQIAAIEAEALKLQSTLAVLDRQMKDGVVLAPASGTVLMRTIEPGEMAAPGVTLMRIADLSQLELRVFLGELDLARVKIGQQLDVLVDALDGASLRGEIAWISSEAEFTPKNAQTRSARTQLVYAIKLRIANPDGKLHIGMPAEVKL
ncbi:efflux RND transporter periplasmic adaptor subunit [candidate division KSB1 bacterium]|nr:efflux RND transporter periplasmic adaptor subunit [candidate division KSB1 bacterium]